MPVELWLGFTLASAALRGTGWATVPGVTLGDFTAMTLSLLGAGAILAASATLFTVLKLAGAAYLVWLGVQLWRSEPSLGALENAREPAGRRRMFWNAYIVTALNPKSTIFFIAFVPQFVDPAHPALPQFAILEATFLVLAAANVTLWAALAGQPRAGFRRPSTLRLVNRIGAGVLIGAAAVTAAAPRTT